MIALLRYQLALHLRMLSSALILMFILLSCWFVYNSPTPEIALTILLNTITSYLIFISLLFVFQLSNIHTVFYSPESIQFRLGRVRNRSMVIGTTLLQIGLLSIVVSLPYAILYYGLFSDFGNGMMATGNLFLYHLFVGYGAFLILRLVGGGSMGTFLVLAILFLIPITFSLGNLVTPGSALHGFWSIFQDWGTSHLTLGSNPMLLYLRGIQDTESITRVLILTPILILSNYVLFLRRDHH